MSAVRVRHRLPAFALRATAGHASRSAQREGCRADLSRRSSTRRRKLEERRRTVSLSWIPHMDTPQSHDQNADQIAYWNGPGGQRWADRQAAQDILLRPIADLL